MLISEAPNLCNGSMGKGVEVMYEEYHWSNCKSSVKIIQRVCKEFSHSKKERSFQGGG